MSASAFWAGFSSGARVDAMSEPGPAPISAVASPGDELHSPAAVAGSATTAAAGVPLDIVASQLCADVRAERAQHAAPRYTTPTCRACRGAGFTRTESSRAECRACDGAGATAELAHGTYEPVVEGVEPEPRGRELADLPELRTRLLEWARTLAESVATKTLLSRTEALMMRDEFVLHVAALDEHKERADEAASARELRDDARDDELQRLRQQVADVERERDEMKAALAAEQRMREQDAATIGHQKLDLEAMRVERDQAVAIALQVAEKVASVSPLMTQAAERIRDLETQLQALADVHGELIVQAVQLRETKRVLEEQNNALATVVALSSERGVA
ncbi:MAG TPA: hypothetical protein VHM19_06200 [Polyangiales bacterium]|jgi:DNA repair exonuclease SbcCD ATPase subunit|nr:hypothetical protein [Polyangiales bacterium]